MARLDTGWHANPKVLQVGLDGMGLHAWSISYCDHARTDGFIPAGAWPALPRARAAVFALLRVGLWRPVPGGYELHDYAVYNRLKAQIEAEQATNAKRQSRHRSRVTDTVTNGVTNGVTLARVGAPGPGPFKSPSSPASSPARQALRSHAPAHEATLPDEVLERLNRPPIETAAMAKPGQAFSDSQKTTDGVHG